jgi:sugar phosphate isomerase/epimerase
VTRPPISVQLYSVREAVAEDLPRALERLASIGFTSVELYGFVDRVDDYRAALDAAGLRAPSGHAPVLGMSDPRPAFEAAAALGLTTLVDPHRPIEHWQDADGVHRTAELINAAAEVGREFGIGFGYHNHWWETESRIDGATALEVLAGELSAEAVLEVDTFWAQVGGVSAVDLLRALGDRVRLIHVKDGAISRDTSTQQPAGQGDAGVAEILAAAPDAGRVLEFDAYAGDTFEGLAESLRFVRELEPESSAA